MSDVKTPSDKWLFFWVIVFLIAIVALCLTSCNAEKQLNKAYDKVKVNITPSEKNKEKIAPYCAAVFPSKERIDSFTTTIQGDLDSAYLRELQRQVQELKSKVPYRKDCDSTAKYYVNIIDYMLNHPVIREDTLKIKVNVTKIDSAANKQLQDENNRLVFDNSRLDLQNGLLTEQHANDEKDKKSLSKVFGLLMLCLIKTWWFWAIVVALLGFGYFKIKSAFTPKIKL